MKPFDLKLACEGAPLQTRDGREVTEFYYFKTSGNTHRCIYVVGGIIYACDIEGSYLGEGHPLDLFLKSEKKKLFIGISRKFRRNDNCHYSSNGYETEDEAHENMVNCGSTNWQIVQVEIDA